MKFIVAYGSMRSDRLGIRLAQYLLKQLEIRGHEATFFDAMELQLPLLDRMYKEYKSDSVPEKLQWMADQIQSSDGVVVVAGEYNHVPQPGLTNLLDHFLEEWLWRPSAIACYSAGRFGGVRAAMPLRAMLAELGMPSIPSLLPVGTVQKTFSVEGILQEPRLQKQVDRFFTELEWYARALVRERQAGVPY
jgi:NAD(P)H-dependent FMN reductase